MLNKQETRYRHKLISENNWNKDEQKDLDIYIKDNQTQTTYKKLYKMYHSGIEVPFVPKQSLRRINKALKIIEIFLTNDDGDVGDSIDILKDITNLYSTLSILHD